MSHAWGCPNGEECPAHSVPLSNIVAQYEDCRRRMHNHPIVRNFEDILNSQVLPNGTTNITNAIFLGMGTITCQGVGLNMDTALEQLVCFGYWMSFLSIDLMPPSRSTDLRNIC